VATAQGVYISLVSVLKSLVLLVLVLVVLLDENSDVE